MSALPQAAHQQGATHTIGSFSLTNHFFRVPLTHGLNYSHEPGAAASSPLATESIEVFAREVVNTNPNLTAPPEQRPFLVYLQGGPGFPSPRPVSDSGWVAELSKTHRVVLLDQRGTGNSTPLTARTITARGDAAAQAAYAEMFRADSIIADAEVVRGFLTADRADKRWSTMGQSYGGFLTLSYLSFAPEALRDCRITAGLAPLTAHIDDVYRATYARCAERNAEYFGWYPEDRELLGRIAAHLRSVPEYLMTGERLTPERLQMLGGYLGGNGRVRGLHYLLESAFAEGPQHLSEQFLAAVSQQVSFCGHPLYALLHESIYADGPAAELSAEPSPSPAPTNWAAARIAAEKPEFAPDAAELLLTGEHIFPWYFEQDPALSPLAEAAELLAVKRDWGRLYDHTRLAANTVPVVAAAYEPDIYVDYGLSMATAAAVGSMSVWTSKTHHHDGLGVDSTAVLGHLNNLLLNR